MAPSKLLHKSIPFIFLFVLLGLLAKQLLFADDQRYVDHMVGKPLPAFNLTDIYNPTTYLSNEDLKNKLTLIHIWASWCPACRREHALLLTLSNTHHIPIYAILYKDEPNKVKKWLTTNGNPYTKIGNDPAGQASIDFGIYGTPETYLVGQDGIILFHHTGAMSQDIIDRFILPNIKSFEKKT